MRWPARGIVVMIGAQNILLLYRKLGTLRSRLGPYPNNHGNLAYIASDAHQK